MASAETGTGVTAGGSLTMTPYVLIGPTFQTPAYGWGTGLFGGIVIPSVATTLNGAINNVVTTITVTSAAAFPSAGRIDIDSELITYTGITATTFTGCGRGANGSTAASHLDNAVVTNATSWDCLLYTSPSPRD